VPDAKQRPPTPSACGIIAASPHISKLSVGMEHSQSLIEDRDGPLTGIDLKIPELGL